MMCEREREKVKAAKCSVLKLNIKREGKPTRESREKRNKET
jgi:hypothetical protein